MDDLQRVAQNDATLTELWIRNSTSESDYVRLGASIGDNTHLTTLKQASQYKNVAGLQEFIEGLKRNTSIHDLKIINMNSINVAGGVAREVMNVYKENNQLTQLSISNSPFERVNNNIIIDTLRGCSNLTKFELTGSCLSDQKLLPMVELLRANLLLEELVLSRNIIGNGGCYALASLLEDPNSHLQSLKIGGFLTHIGCQGMVSIANALARNYQLKHLDIGGRNNLSQTDVTLVKDVFYNLYYNKASINSTYASNHTLQTFVLPWTTTIISDNHDPNKHYVAIKKILAFHPYIDMRPMFDWDMEGERNLKALPYVISWFEKAEEAVSGDYGGENYSIHARKLSAIYQFARAMPLLVIPVSHNKVDEEKRKRNEL